MSRSPLPDVIFLNGSSSAGKTSITRGLQARLPEPYLNFGIDHVFPWLPPHWWETPEGLKLVPLSSGETPLRMGPGGLSVLRAWHRMARAGVDAGMRIIIDEVLFDPRLLPDWIEALTGCDVFFVGVRCGLAELKRREKARGDRAEGQALWLHERVHAEIFYDLEIDTTVTSTEACVDQILAALETRTRPSVFERLAIL